MWLYFFPSFCKQCNINIFMGDIIYSFCILLLLFFLFFSPLQVAGILWRANFLMIQTALQVPVAIGNIFDKFIGRFLESADTSPSSLPMGATLELQQQERLDRIEQQMLMTAMRASRRMEIGHPQPLVSWLVGCIDLNHFH